MPSLNQFSSTRRTTALFAIIQKQAVDINNLQELVLSLQKQLETGKQPVTQSIFGTPPKSGMNWADDKLVTAGPCLQKT